MNTVEKFKLESVPVNKILFAVTSEPDYEMTRIYITENYPTWGDMTVINGGHCSCYGFDETNWDATTYTEDEFSKLMASWLTTGYGVERIIARLWFETSRK